MAGVDVGEGVAAGVDVGEVVEVGEGVAVGVGGSENMGVGVAVGVVLQPVSTITRERAINREPASMNFRIFVSPSLLSFGGYAGHVCQKSSGYIS